VQCLERYYKRKELREIVYNGVTITEMKEMRQIKIMSKREDKISENTIGIGIIICKKSESKS